MEYLFKNLRLLSLALLISLNIPLSAQTWTSINIDKVTTAAMTGALLEEHLAEKKSNEAANHILKKYVASAVASSGICFKEYMEFKALSDPTSFFTSNKEYFYYQHIYKTAKDIGILTSKLAPYLIRRPEKIFYWGTYMFQTLNETIELCKIFQSVCTNGKLGFEKLRFRQLAPDLMKYINPAKDDFQGYKQSFSNLISTEGLDSLTNNDVKEALQDLANVGSSFASSGWNMEDNYHYLINPNTDLNGKLDNFIYNLNPRSKILSALKMKYSAAKYLYEGYKETKETIEKLSQGENLKNTIRNLILVNGHEVADRIFHIADYNVNTYMADYVKKSSEGFYTQRYYIYSVSNVKKEIYRNPKAKILSEANYKASGITIKKGPFTREQVTRVQKNWTKEQQDAALKRAEEVTGWSQSKVDNYNNTHPGHHYKFIAQLNSLSKTKQEGNQWYFYVLLMYRIRIEDDYVAKNEIYEEVYDSRTMNKAAFEEKLKTRLLEFNDHEEGEKYKIGSDEPVPYEGADPEQLANANAVTITRDCMHGDTLANSSLSWKENGKQGKQLDGRSIEFAMASNIQGGTLQEDIKGIENLINQNKQEMEPLKKSKQDLLSQNKDLYNQMSYESQRHNYVKYQELHRKYEENDKKIEGLDKEIDKLIQHEVELKEKLQELKKDYDGVEDDANRLPSIKKSLESAFGINWVDEGHWDTSDPERYVYTCKGKYKELGEVTFKAALTLVKKPQKLLGIRIHRAIMRIEWALTNEGSHSEVVEVVKIDSTWTAAKKKDEVNQHLSFWLSNSPNCTCKLEYQNQEKDTLDVPETAAHLLWVSDRLAVASDVDARLTKIANSLNFLLQYYQIQTSIKDLLKEQIISVLDVRAKSALSVDCLEKWRKANNMIKEEDLYEHRRRGLKEIANGTH